MKLFFEIYLLGCFVSLIITLIHLKKKGDSIVNKINDEVSEKLNFYERMNFANANIYCAINFVMSWAQVAMFVYSFIPSPFFIKLYFYRFTSEMFIWIYRKSGEKAQNLVNKYNSLIEDYNKKNANN
jgi:hypothetical protein